jgi:hypothetical protein
MARHTKLYTFVEPIKVPKKPKLKLKDIFKINKKK